MATYSYKIKNLKTILKQQIGQDEKREIRALKKIQLLKQRGQSLSNLKTNKIAMVRYYWHRLDKAITS